MGKRDFTGGKSPFVDQALISLSSFLLPFFVGILKGGPSSLSSSLPPSSERWNSAIEVSAQNGKTTIAPIRQFVIFFAKVFCQIPLDIGSLFCLPEESDEGIYFPFLSFLQGFRSEFITSSSHCFTAKKDFFIPLLRWFFCHGNYAGFLFFSLLLPPDQILDGKV